MSRKIMTGGFNKKMLVEYRKDTKNTTISIIRYWYVHIWNYCGTLNSHTVPQNTPAHTWQEANRNGCVPQETFISYGFSTSSCFLEALRSFIISGERHKCGAQEGKIILWVLQRGRDAPQCCLMFTGVLLVSLQHRARAMLTVPQGELEIASCHLQALAGDWK